MSSVNTARLRLEHNQDTSMLCGCPAGSLIAALRSRIKTSGCHSCRRDNYRLWQLNLTTIGIASSFSRVNVLRRRCQWYHCTPLQYLARCMFLSSHRSRLLTGQTDVRTLTAIWQLQVSLLLCGRLDVGLNDASFSLQFCSHTMLFSRSIETWRASGAPDGPRRHSCSSQTRVSL
ncbi:hypothetical protein K466DRAFT_364836 [Polyporus arcularius HHB13444]|uniref:Uncharacterized protein n=1 Tax=Polyporus arcularius HHB13444 TaxID=1314778 RepID=A0A5C3NXS4_9APHY|nr:hypothetical protein K466DRAFT_364836 [Polyporus arcularius HHB13444]